MFTHTHTHTMVTMSGDGYVDELSCGDQDLSKHSAIDLTYIQCFHGRHASVKLETHRDHCGSIMAAFSGRKMQRQHERSRLRQIPKKVSSPTRRFLKTRNKTRLATSNTCSASIRNGQETHSPTVESLHTTPTAHHWLF